MNLQNPRRNELTGIPWLNNALDFILSRINAIWLVEHDVDGRHTDLTASSLTLASNAITGATGDLSTDGNLTVGEGTNTIGEFISRDGDGQARESLEIGGSTDGWRIARENVTSPFTSGYAFALHHFVNSAFDVLQIGYNATLGYYLLEPHDQKGLALGINAADGGNNADRLKYVAVTDGVYEAARTAAAGYWTAVAFSAGNFTADVGTWTVDSGDVLQNQYTLIGKTLFWKLAVSASDVSNAGAILRATLPASLTTASADIGTHVGRASDAGGATVASAISWDASATFVRLYSTITGTVGFAITAGDNTAVLFSVQIEVT